MKPPTGFGIAADFGTAFGLAGNFQVIFYVVLKIVRVHKILAGVVRRVYVNQLHLAGIAFLQQLEHFQVVAFNHQVLRGVPVHALLRARAQRAGAGGQGQLAGAAFAVPVEAVFFVRIGGGFVAHQGFEHIHIHGHAVRVFGQQFRKQLFQLRNVGAHQIGRLRLGAGSFDFLHGQGLS